MTNYQTYRTATPALVRWMRSETVRELAEEVCKAALFFAGLWAVGELLSIIGRVVVLFATKI